MNNKQYYKKLRKLSKSIFGRPYRFKNRFMNDNPKNKQEKNTIVSLEEIARAVKCINEF